MRGNELTHTKSPRYVASQKLLSCSEWSGQDTTILQMRIMAHALRRSFLNCTHIGAALVTFIVRLYGTPAARCVPTSQDVITNLLLKLFTNNQ